MTPPATGEAQERGLQVGRDSQNLMRSALTMVLVVVWVLSAVGLWTQLDIGWVPHDEGGIGQSAERVLAGELPHRDFDEIYTGGLTYLNALALHLFGVDLRASRIVLFLFFVAWVPALYYVATRFIPPVAAGATTLLAVAWSVPAYIAAVPSWYNLFFAVFGTAALLRYLENEKGRFLILAGIFAGLSCLIKIVGLFFVAAVLLFLAFREQQLTSQLHNGSGKCSPDQRTLPYTAFASTGLLLFLSLLVSLVWERLGAREAVHFILPAAAIATLFLLDERRVRARSSRQRFGQLGRLLGPFLTGLAVPVALFLVPYAASGALLALFEGVFVSPMQRLSFAATRPPALLPSMIPTAAITLLLAVPHWRSPTRARLRVAAYLALLAGLITAPSVPAVYQLVWLSIRTLVPVLTVAGVMLLAHARNRGSLSDIRRQQLTLLLCVTGMVNLVQFPYSAPVYFSYVAPFVAVTGAAILASQRHRSRQVPAAVLCFYLLFGVLWVDRTFISTMSLYYAPTNQTELLELDRGGLRVSPREKDEYEALVAEMKSRATGTFTYATPDCPEVYFLSGLRNPTRTIFDFFDRPEGRTERVLEALDRHGVGVIALNRSPSFSPPPPLELTSSLVERYPQSTQIGRFEVRWRN